MSKNLFEENSYFIFQKEFYFSTVNVGQKATPSKTSETKCPQCLQSKKPYCVCRYYQKLLNSNNRGLDLSPLIQVKDELNSIKSSLDSLDIDLWKAHTRSTELTTEVKHDLRHLDIQMMTGAWLKLYEMIKIYDLMTPSRVTDPTESATYRSAHLCECPGGFINATNHYWQSHYAGTKWEWNALSLNPYNECNDLQAMIDDDVFYRETFERWWRGADNTGNILSLDNYRHVTSSVFRPPNGGPPTLFDFITSDGSVDSQFNANEQENITSQLHFAEFVWMISLLKKGGNMVLKMFTLFENDSATIVALSCLLFETTIITKPFLSKAGNSEVYLIAKNFHGVSSSLITILKGYLASPSPPARLNPEILSQLLPDFVEEFTNCSTFFSKMQMEFITRNIQSFRGTKIPAAEIAQLRKKLSHNFVQRMQIQPLQNPALKIVTKPFLSRNNLKGVNNNSTRSGRRNSKAGVAWDRFSKRLDHLILQKIREKTKNDPRRNISFMKWRENSDEVNGSSPFLLFDDDETQQELLKQMFKTDEQGKGKKEEFRVEKEGLHVNEKEKSVEREYDADAYEEDNAFGDCGDYTMSWNDPVKEEKKVPEKKETEEGAGPQKKKFSALEFMKTKFNYEEGKGLGATGEGIVEPIHAGDNNLNSKKGLGYFTEREHIDSLPSLLHVTGKELLQWQNYTKDDRSARARKMPDAISKIALQLDWLQNLHLHITLPSFASVPAAPSLSEIATLPTTPFPACAQFSQQGGYLELAEKFPIHKVQMSRFCDTELLLQLLKLKYTFPSLLAPSSPGEILLLLTKDYQAQPQLAAAPSSIPLLPSICLSQILTNNNIISQFKVNTYLELHAKTVPFGSWLLKRLSLQGIISYRHENSYNIHAAENLNGDGKILHHTHEGYWSVLHSYIRSATNNRLDSLTKNSSLHQNILLKINNEVLSFYKKRNLFLQDYLSSTAPELIIADCLTDENEMFVSREPCYLEKRAFLYFLSALFTGVNTIKDNGVMIFRIGSMLLRPTVGVMALLHLFFRQVKVSRPECVSSVQSQTFVIAVGFKDQSERRQHSRYLLNSLFGNAMIAHALNLEVVQLLHPSFLTCECFAEKMIQINNALLAHETTEYENRIQQETDPLPDSYNEKYDLFKKELPKLMGSNYSRIYPDTSLSEGLFGFVSLLEDGKDQKERNQREEKEDNVLSALDFADFTGCHYMPTSNYSYNDEVEEEAHTSIDYVNRESDENLIKAEKKMKMDVAPSSFSSAEWDLSSFDQVVKNQPQVKEDHSGPLVKEEVKNNLSFVPHSQALQSDTSFPLTDPFTPPTHKSIPPAKEEPQQQVEEEEESEEESEEEDVAGIYTFL